MFESHHLRNEITANEKQRQDLETEETPSFDELLNLVKHQPSEFETLSTELCHNVIQLAPDRLKRRLAGIQFTIDLKREQTNSATATCLKLSCMMRESLLELHAALADPEAYLREHQSPKQSADIIPLFPGVE
jgi:hypothetical protein